MTEIELLHEAIKALKDERDRFKEKLDIAVKGFEEIIAVSDDRFYESQDDTLVGIANDSLKEIRDLK